MSMDELWMDEAYLNISSAATDPVFVYRRNANCDGCPFVKFPEVSPATNSENGR